MIDRLGEFKVAAGVMGDSGSEGELGEEAYVGG